ncbi:MAG: type II toxin-antitoxin system VapC family toxin [Syntrophobacteraceae bacterium]|nr:type II toxin-antitoxin system VapC family toxin [Syntrophobacteraceae bacterium]
MDTNIYSDFAEGLPEVVNILAASDENLFMPSIVLGELSYGFMKGSRRDFNENKLRQIMNQLKMEIITVDEHVARKYAIIYTALVKKGRKIPINDVWIAACCMQAGGTLLTRDKHFELIDHIETVIVKAPPRTHD